MKTSIVPPSAPAWVMVDAAGQSIGHVAALVAHRLRGKHKPAFSPHQLCGDQVIVINAAGVSVHPGKLSKKAFVKHSGYLGHLKTIPLAHLLEKDPAEVLRLAVKGMLPRNTLRDHMLKRLHIFADASHPHAAQQPVTIAV